MNSRRHSERGVTLIEMMIVVTLIALMTGITFPAISSGIDSLRMSTASEAVAGFIQTAITRTERRQQMLQLTVSKQENAIMLAGAGYNTRYTLPDGVTIAAVLPTDTVLLYPGGAPPRIQVRLLNRRGAQRLISLDPITGVAQIDRGVQK